jgi:integrase
MMTAGGWNIGGTMLLTRRELALVLADLERRARRSLNSRMNLVIFRLACCCGLRASEIIHLRLDDLRVEGERPHVRVRVEIAKGGRARRVPLWWDAGTLRDLGEWKQERLRQGATDTCLVICSVQAHARGRKLSRQGVRYRFRTACRALGDERVQELTIHHGRHTFISHALAGGRSLAEVRDAAGHSNVSVTSLYLHVAVDDDGAVGGLFETTSR